MIFREELAAAIIRGEKTATRRQLSENPRSPWHVESNRYAEGSTFTVNPGRGVGHVAECEVTRRALQTLAVLTAEQARMEGFRSVLAFRDAWAKINGHFNPAQLVRVVEFRLVGPDCLACGGTGAYETRTLEPECCGNTVGGECRGDCAVPREAVDYQPCTPCFGTGVAVSELGRQLLERLEDAAAA